uniref:DDE Tnp4 domain-containing protein n=1 Tax=Amphimedon queenslandica TaxID=400682 RepID=A0A1X7TTH8_AMPQE
MEEEVIRNQEYLMNEDYQLRAMYEEIEQQKKHEEERKREEEEIEEIERLCYLRLAEVEAVEHEEDGQMEDENEEVSLLQDISAAEDERMEALLPQDKDICPTDDLSNNSTAESEEHKELVTLRLKVAKLELRLKKVTFSVELLKDNDKLVLLYTGLPSWPVFMHTFQFVSKFVTPSLVLSLEDEMLLTLSRLRLDLTLNDLAVRFAVSVATVSRIFDKWIDALYARLQFLIKWPSREICTQNMPPFIKELYPACRCIIDCTEIFIEKPSGYVARSKTFSNYKKHNTVKLLIAITPSGSISFVSKCWGGKVSDKVLTQESGFLSLLERGDVVLADRGFTISDDVGLVGAKLEIPAFTRGKGQLSRDVEMTKNLSHFHNTFHSDIFVDFGTFLSSSFSRMLSSFF